MAERKSKAPEVIPEEIIPEEIIPEEIPQAPVDPWSEMVEIKLPRAAKGEPNYEIASVNGKVFKIMKGEKVKVPAPIAEVIQHSFSAQDAAAEYIASKIDE